MDTFITVDMYIFIVMAFLWTPLIKNQILRYVVYKPHLLLLLLLYQKVYTNIFDVPHMVYVWNFYEKHVSLSYYYSIHKIHLSQLSMLQLLSF